MMPLRSRSIALAALLTAVVLPAPALAVPCLPLMCKFSISGKKGAFLKKQVSAEKLKADDLAMTAKSGDGRSLAARSVNRGEFRGTGLSMPATTAALRTMIDKFDAAWVGMGLRKPMPVSLRIVGSSDFNPSALPDGTILVPLGVLMQASSDDEVAWVMAHEYSHIALAHFARSQRKEQTASSIGDVVRGLQSAAEIAHRRVDTSGDRIRITYAENSDVKNLTEKVWAHSRDLKLGLGLLNQRLARKQEDEADVAGIDLVIAAGYSDEGAGDAFDTIEDQSKRHAKLVASFDQRMATFGMGLAGKAVERDKKGADLGQIFNGLVDDVTKNVGRALKDKLIDMAGSTHRPAEKRKKGVSEYLDKAYADFGGPAKQTKWLDAVRATKEFANGKIAVDAVTEASDLLRQDSVPGAQQALARALGTPFANTPLVANTAADVRWRAGDLAGADRLFTIAAGMSNAAPAPAGKGTKGKAKGKGKAAAAPAPIPVASLDPYLSQSLDGFQAHVQLLIKMRAYPKALTVIAEAKRRFGDEEGFYPSLIAIYVQTKNNAMIQQTLDRCGMVADEALKQECAAALWGEDSAEQVDKLLPADRAQLKLATAKLVDTSQRASWFKRLTDSVETSED